MAGSKSGWIYYNTKQHVNYWMKNMCSIYWVKLLTKLCICVHWVFCPFVAMTLNLECVLRWLRIMRSQWLNFPLFSPLVTTPINHGSRRLVYIYIYIYILTLREIHRLIQCSTLRHQASLLRVQKNRCHKWHLGNYPVIMNVWCHAHVYIHIGR